jgi:hypothetical protein
MQHSREGYEVSFPKLIVRTRLERLAATLNNVTTIAAPEVFRLVAYWRYELTDAGKKVAQERDAGDVTWLIEEICGES